MAVVVSKLDATNCANDMCHSRLGLLYDLRIFFFLRQSPGEVFHIFVILLSEVIMVLLSEFSLLQQLEDACSEGRLVVEARDIKLTDMDF